MGFFTNKDGSATSVQDGEDEAGVPFTEAEPGQFGVLPDGMSFESFNPDYPHANYEPFVTVKPTRQSMPGSSVIFDFVTELSPATTALTEDTDVTPAAASRRPATCRRRA